MQWQPLFSFLVSDLVQRLQQRTTVQKQAYLHGFMKNNVVAESIFSLPRAIGNDGIFNTACTTPCHFHIKFRILIPIAREAGWRGGGIDVWKQFKLCFRIKKKRYESSWISCLCSTLVFLTRRKPLKNRASPKKGKWFAKEPGFY